MLVEDGAIGSVAKREHLSVNIFASITTLSLDQGRPRWNLSRQAQHRVAVVVAAAHVSSFWYRVPVVTKSERLRWNTERKIKSRAPTNVSGRPNTGFALARQQRDSPLPSPNTPRSSPPGWQQKRQDKNKNRQT